MGQSVESEIPLHPALASQEFRLIADCCRESFVGSRRSQKLLHSIDWDAVRHLSRRHRIAGIVAHALRDVPHLPVDMRSWLADESDRITAHNMRMIAECARLKAAFATANIDHLFLKGVAVGKLAYGNALIKEAWDIDLLVDPSNVLDAARLLRELGYSIVTPRHAKTDDLAKWHRRRRESVWRNDAGLFVELHTALTDHPGLLPWAPMDAPRQSVDIIDGVTLQTFAQPQQIAYLAAHGASSGWFRLKWLSEFAALLAGGAVSTEFVDDVNRVSAGKFTDLAIALSDAIFGLKLEIGLRRRFERDGQLRKMMRLCAGLLADGEPTEQRFGTWPIHKLQFAAHDGLPFKLAELRTQILVALANRTR
jgi:hypothetical protein